MLNSTKLTNASSIEKYINNETKKFISTKNGKADIKTQLSNYTNKKNDKTYFTSLNYSLVGTVRLNNEEIKITDNKETAALLVFGQGLHTTQDQYAHIADKHNANMDMTNMDYANGKWKDVGEEKNNRYIKAKQATVSKIDKFLDKNEDKLFKLPK
jgi:hypothetical protein